VSPSLVTPGAWFHAHSLREALGMRAGCAKGNAQSSLCRLLLLAHKLRKATQSKQAAPVWRAHVLHALAPALGAKRCMLCSALPPFPPPCPAPTWHLASCSASHTHKAHATATSNPCVKCHRAHDRFRPLACSEPAQPCKHGANTMPTGWPLTIAAQEHHSSRTHCSLRRREWCHGM